MEERRLSRLTILLSACAFAMLALVPPASASSSAQSTRYSVPRYGFSVALPASWKVIPRSVAGVRAAAAKARSRGQSSLAAQYKGILNDPYSRKDVTTAAFDAFEWPQPRSPITTDLLIHAYHASDRDLQNPNLLGTIATLLAKELNSAGFAEKPQHLTLPVGKAILIVGASQLDPSYGGALDGVATYLLIRGHTVFEITGRSDSRLMTLYAPLFRRIAFSVRF
jgi:hypothetical protein